MGDSKSIGQLLKELDAMQKQFDHLNEELIVENRKKKKVKTKLSSNEIDDDFFKTFSAPLTEKPKNEKIKEVKEEKPLPDDELLFELEVEQEIVKERTEEASREKKIDEEAIIPSIEAKEKVNNTKPLINQEHNELKNKEVKIEESVSDKKDEIKDYSYLTIKERLEYIQKGISSKEEILKKEKLKNNQNLNKKVFTLKNEALANEVLTPKVNNSVSKKKELKNKSSVLEPKSQVKATSKKPKNTANNTVLQPKKETPLSSKKTDTKNKSVLKSTNPVKKELKKETIKSTSVNDKKPSTNKSIKASKQKNQKMETVDKLTIIILILLIVLLVTAWVLLF